MNFTIRPIEQRDDKAVEAVIRTCLMEYGANREGTAWGDPYLNRFSTVYVNDNQRYWVAEDENGKIVGGVGIGPLPGCDDTCEVQKMYCYKEVRGSGVASMLMNEALAFARLHYKRAYLETMENMIAAKKFYEKYGFVRLEQCIGDTGHPGCDVPYAREI